MIPTNQAAIALLNNLAELVPGAAAGVEAVEDALTGNKPSLSPAQDRALNSALSAIIKAMPAPVTPAPAASTKK